MIAAALLLLLSVGGAQADTPQTLEGEPMVTTRVSLPYYSLGPAPFPVSIDHLDFQLFGDAHIDKGSLRLTNAVQSQRGAVWSKSPLQTNNWQVDLRFQVGGSPNLDHFGDGFAFWVVKERGVVGEALGGPDEFTGLGVFFDTFKNDNFRTKKHPWVYGKFNTQKGKYADLGENHLPPVNGCHAPFRDADPTVLATTVARITLLNNVLSVVMRPRGAVDWIQCFEIQNVPALSSPTSEYYIGVTAMTGGLVDNHHFLQLSMYGNVDVQPFAYSHAYKITQMPEMWRAMQESGRIAREFADWEEQDSFSDDLKWTVAGGSNGKGGSSSHAADDDYDEVYNGHGNNGDEEEEHTGEGEDDDDEEPYRVYTDENGDEVDGEEEEEEADPDSDTDDSSSTSLPIGDLLHQLPQQVQAKLHDNHVLNQEMMRNVRLQMQKRMQAVTDQMHRAAREIRNKEHALSLRILDLGQRLKVQVTDPFEHEAQQSQSNWWYPFWAMVLVIAAVAWFGRSRYNKFMKQHVL